MNDQGPFDRILDPGGGSRDTNARMILIGMGVIGVILLILVLPPFSILSGGDDKSANGQPALSRSSNAKASKGPEGFEILSKVEPLSKPKGTNGPYALTVKLTQTVTDGRNLALYTSKSGRWERLASATLVNN